MLQAMTDILFGPGRDRVPGSGSTAPLKVPRPSPRTLESMVHRVVDNSNGSARAGNVRQMLAGMTEAIFGPAADDQLNTARSSVRSAFSARSAAPQNANWELQSLLTELCAVLYE